MNENGKTKATVQRVAVLWRKDAAGNWRFFGAAPASSLRNLLLSAGTYMVSVVDCGDVHSTTEITVE